MSELINKYLDFGGLQKYDALIKEFIAKGNGTLADAIDALTAKIGNIDVEGSDSKTLAEIVEDIYASIAEIVEKQGSLDDKDGELEGKINDIIGDLESLGDSDAVMTLVEISNKLKALDDANVVGRLSAVEDAVSKLGDLGDGTNLGTLVQDITANTAAIEKLNGEADVEGSVKKAAADAQAAAIAAAEAAAAQALADAKADTAESLKDYYTKEETDGLVDALNGNIESAAADAQAAAEATAAADATSKADAAESAAKTYADSLVKDAEGKSLFDAAGAAATAEQNAKDYADSLATNYDAAGSAAAAQSAAEATAAADATSKANAAQAAAEATAASLYQVKGNYETAGAAATAQAAAIEAAAADATEKADAAKDTAIEAAAADATEKADAAQAAAIESAAADAQAKADAAQAAALASAKEYVDAISHAANVDYDEDTKKINLYDANGEKIGEGFDATPFIVDGMLENVNFVDDSDSDAVNTKLRFTFNTDSGKKEIDVDFSEYVDVYHADNSSIALDSATNTFSVKNVEATKTKTVGKIPVAGGPLAKLFENAGIDVSDIAAGSSVEDIFMSLLCKELWPESIETKDATLTSSCANPTVTLNSKTSGSSDVEVGTSVAYSVSSGKSSYTATPHTASKLAYGYSAADDGSVDSTDTTKKASFGTISAVSTSVPKLTLSGLVTETVEGTAGSAAAGAVSTSGNVVIEEGEKTLSAYGTSITFTGTCSELPAVFGCSNLGKTNDNGTVYKSSAKDEITKTSTAVNSSTVSVKCVGKYKYFIGYSDKTTFDQFDSASVRALTTKSGYITVNGTTTPVGTTAIESNGKSIIVAVPKKYKLSNIENGVGASILSNFSSVGEVSVATGILNTTYTVYVYPITNGAVVAFKNVTITKA